MYVTNRRYLCRYLKTPTAKCVAVCDATRKPVSVYGMWQHYVIIDKYTEIKCQLL